MLLLTGCVQKQVVPTTPQEVNTSKPINVSQPILDEAFVPQALKIAMILPSKKIGRYAHSTSTALFAYLLSRQHPFVFKTFQIKDESSHAMQTVVQKIEEDGFDFVIAPLTKEGATNLAALDNNLTFFLPTIHQNDMKQQHPNIYYGAINYQKQIDTLMTYAASPLVVMYDTSAQGQHLKEMSVRAYQKRVKGKIYTYGINKKRSSVKNYLKDNHNVQHGSFVLNTPFIKSTMILSQLTLYDVEAENILSTQINYDPLLFSMTQYRDRKHVYIANSIDLHNDKVSQSNALLSNDIIYDWINYTSTVGADLFFYMMTGEERLYDLPIHEQQVYYPISIVQAKKARYEKVN